MDMHEDRNHIVIYNNGEKKIIDSHVHYLAPKAYRWDFVTRFVSGFTEEMLLIANLIFQVEYHFSMQLNTFLEAGGLSPADHVIQALHRLKNKFLKKEALSVALKKLFTLIEGSRLLPDLHMT